MTGWKLVDHCCAECLGRIVVRRFNDRHEYRCADCGHVGYDSHEAVCVCGREVRGMGAVFECFVNKEKSPALPNEIMVREREWEPKTNADKK
jgi:hypothetical protein